MKSADFQTMLDVARSRDPSASLEAARKLETLAEPERYEAMTAILLSANSLVSDLAANTMEEYGQRGLDALVVALPQAKPLSQVKIVSALEHLGMDGAVEPLMALLSVTDITMLRTLAIQALGRLGAVQAAELIRSFAEDNDHHVRERVALALAQLEETSRT